MNGEGRIAGRDATSHPAGEGARDYSGAGAHREGHLQHLIRQLKAPARCCGAVPIRAGELQLMSCAGGYSLGRRS